MNLSFILLASTLSSERSEETEAVHLVGKDHICLLFPLKHRDGEKFDSPGITSSYFLVIFLLFG